MAKKKTELPMEAPETVEPKKKRAPNKNVKELAEIKAKLEATEHLLETTQMQLNDATTKNRQLVAQYSRISNYIIKALNVFYESVMMAFKEDN